MSKNKIIKLIIIFTIFFAVLFCLRNFVKDSAPIPEVSETNNDVTEEEKPVPIKEEGTLPIKEEILAPEPVLPQSKIIGNVPFTSQAPFGDWADPKQQHGCEEASLVMAHYFLTGEKLTPEIALQEITAMSDFEMEHYGHFHDTSVADTLKIFKEYYGHENAFVKYDITLEDIKTEIAKGNLVIVPTNGVKLKNPNYTAPGPLLHELVITGYDDNAQEFITNDPGTRKGKSYRYDYTVFMNAIRDYKTGFDEPIEEERKAMIVVPNN